MSESGRPDKERSGDSSVPATVDAPEYQETPPDDSDAGTEAAGGAQSQAGGETSSTSEPKEPDEPKRRRCGRGAWVVAIIAIIIALLSAGNSVYLWYRATRSMDQVKSQVATQQKGHDQRIKALQNSLSRVNQVASSQQQQSQQMQALGNRVGKVSQRMGQLSHQLSSLTELLRTDRRAWELVQVRHLLTVANDRLQLSRDVAGAATALAIAERRMAQLDDPGLIPVREAVSQELQKLRSVQQVDVSGMAIQLSTLAADVPQLPLKRSIPSHYSPQGGQKSAPAGDQWWQRALNSVSGAVQKMVTIRRNQKPTPALMAPSHEFFLYQNLQLKLESARLALLQRRTPVFRQTLKTARQWLDTYFKADDPGVQAMKQSLDKMTGQELKPNLPDISRSLHLLRQRLQNLENTTLPANQANQPKPGTSQ